MRFTPLSAVAVAAALLAMPAAAGTTLTTNASGTNGVGFTTDDANGTQRAGIGLMFSGDTLPRFARNLCGRLPGSHNTCGVGVGYSLWQYTPDEARERVPVPLAGALYNMHLGHVSLAQSSPGWQGLLTFSVGVANPRSSSHWLPADLSSLYSVPDVAAEARNRLPSRSIVQTELLKMHPELAFAPPEVLRAKTDAAMAALENQLPDEAELEKLQAKVNARAAEQAAEEYTAFVERDSPGRTVYNVHGDVAFPGVLGVRYHGLNFAVNPTLGFAAGNAFTYARAGVAFTVGNDAAHHLPLFNTALPAQQAHTTNKNWQWRLSVTPEVNHNIYDITTDSGWEDIHTNRLEGGVFVGFQGSGSGVTLRGGYSYSTPLIGDASTGDHNGVFGVSLSASF